MQQSYRSLNYFLLVAILSLVGCSKAHIRVGEDGGSSGDGGNGNNDGGNGDGGDDGGPMTSNCDTTLAPFGGGVGTLENPFRICTKAQFDEVRDDMYFEQNFRVEADFVLGDFDPIARFTGSFDGNGHTLSDWTHNNPSENNVALFRALQQQAVVSNLTLENVSVSGGTVVAGLAGTASVPVRIENVHVTGSVTGTGDFVAGVVVQLGGKLENASFDGTITAGGSQVGGIATIITNNGSATQVSAKGSIKWAGAGARSLVGGIAASLPGGTIEQCVSRMTIASDTNEKAGGIVGEASSAGDLSGTVRDCYAIADIGSVADASGIAGSLAGATLERVYYTGTLTGVTLDPVAAAVSGSNTITDVLWDASAVGVPSGVVGATPKTTIELQMANTFDGWPLAVWDIQTGAMPSLKFEK